MLGTWKSAGTDTLSASASAAAREEALEKRATGSLARARRMTIVSAGEMVGLMSTGEMGVVLVR